MYRLKKKGFIITSVIIMTLSGIAGCSKITENEDSSEITTIEGEDLDVFTQASGEDAKENAGASNTGNLNANTSNTDAESADAQNGNKSGSGYASGEDALASLDGDSTNNLHYINESKDLYGDICEVGDMQFTVTEIYMETGDNGAEIMVSQAPGAAEETSKITVVYDENTKFVKLKIWDGGANHEEQESTAADLKKGFTAEMNGSYEGGVFHATDILIVEVILD